MPARRHSKSHSPRTASQFFAARPEWASFFPNTTAYLRTNLQMHQKSGAFKEFEDWCDLGAILQRIA
jgi:hypothetical protein